MTKLEFKITSDYWLQKLKKQPVSRNEQFHLITSDKLVIPNENIAYFLKLTNNNLIVEYTVLFAVYTAMLQRYFEPNHFIFSTKVTDENTPLLLCHNFIEDKNLKQYLNTVRAEIQEVYKYTSFDADFNLSKKFKSYTTFGFGYNTSIAQNEIPFFLNVTKSTKGLLISITYAESFKKSYVVEHFIKNLQNCLENLETNLLTKICDIPTLTKAEEETILKTFNNTALSFPLETSIPDLFEAQVAKTPENTALIIQDVSYTYKELNEKANALANYLVHKHHIQATDFVGIKLERTELLIISLLAVLKTGAVYVPIDKDYPEERIAYIENDSQCKLVIDETLSFFNDSNEHYTTENLGIRKNATDVAYIIYTSGTTGKPKGVMITHQNAVAMIQWASTTFDTTTFDTVFAVTSHCFDLSIYEIFYTLSTGKKIRLLQNAIEIPDYLQKDQNILINTVPSVMRMLMEDECDLKNVRIINLAGEPYPLDIAEYILEKNIVTNNLYGPSEDTTYSTAFTLTPQTYESIPIGKPISNTQAYILDEHLQPVPIGVIGKLYLSGLGVTKGYLNRPELTKEKYIKNPFNTSQFMYDTGDLTSWMPDGNIKFYGRKDHQVKLRGYRIELGEIEHQISKFNTEIQGAVVALKQVNNEQCLVAYYVANTPIQKEALRVHLEAKLPIYMVPTYFQKIEEIPLTPNKKVNKNALPEIAQHSTTQAVYEAPRNQVEVELLEIWKTVLSVDTFGVNDNFFALGGHSLMISQIINKMHKTLKKTISYKEFYKNPTIAGISEQLDETEYKAIPKLAEATAYPVTAAQHRLWLLSQLDDNLDAYTISGAIRIDGKLQFENFQKAFNHVVKKHEILRTYFATDSQGSLQQYIMPISEIVYTIEVHNLSKSVNQLAETQNFIQQQLKETFHLDKSPLFNIKLIRWNKTETILFIAIHHIISDGWSLEVLTSEILKAYTEITSKGAANNEPLPIQFKEYASWINEKQQNSLASQKAYWETQFQGKLPKLNIPIGTNKRPALKTYKGESIQYSFSNELLTQLKNSSAAQHVPLFSVIMTAVKTLLYGYSFQKDIIIGTPVAGRIHPDLENQLGLYLNTLAIRSQFSENDNFKTVLFKEHQAIAAAHANQEYPFDKLVETLNVERDTSRSPLFDVMVVLQNYQQLVSLNTDVSESILAISPFKTERTAAQFDVTFTFVEAEELKLELQYNTAIYQPDFIQRVCKDLEHIFTQIVTNIELPISAITLLSDEEKIIVANASNIEDPQNITTYDFVAPTTEIEQKVAAIWKEILKIETISITDDFFKLGGHSLLLNKLRNAYHKTFQAEISLKDLYLKTAMTAHVALLEQAEESVYIVIEKAPTQALYDISTTQRRYWLLYKIFGKSKEFNIYDNLNLGSNLQREHFEKAFNVLKERHEMLRAVFVDDQGIPKQKITTFSSVTIPFFETETEAKAYTFDHEFSLETYPLYKVSLAKQKDDFVLFFNIHHSISDGWSMNVIVQELMDVYNALTLGETPTLPEVSIQYKDYVVWQQEQAQSEALQKQESYWENQLAGDIPYLQLPVDYAVSVKTATTGSAYHAVYFNKDSKNNIESLATKHNVSVFSIVAAALKILLARLTGEEDITFGIPAANRNHEQLKHIVGSFINTLMLRNSVEKQGDFITFVKALNVTLIEALENQNYPFEQLLEKLAIPTQEGRFPLSPVFLNLLDFEAKSTEKITDFSARHGHIEASPKFDFECYVKNYANGLELKTVYDQSRFKEETIAYWMQALVEIINQVVTNDTKQIKDIVCFEHYLPTKVSKRPTNEFTYFEATEIQQSIAARFEKQVVKYSNAIAVESNGNYFSYKELNEKANQLAHTILKQSSTSQRIALLLEHDESCILGMLGSLKAGFGYVPIDNSDPLQRIQFILNDAACDILIYTKKSADKIAELIVELPHIKCIELAEAFSESNKENPALAIHPTSNAYVLYTSGSTGNPKGVVQNQQNVLHYIRVYTNEVHIHENDNLSLFSTYTFDASVKDIYAAILNGATVCLYNIPERGMQTLANWFETQQISIIHMVPTIYRYFLKSLPFGTQLNSIRLIDLGGEACYKSDIDLFKKYFSKEAFLVNDYGPTEATIVSQNFISHDTEITKTNVPLGTTVTETDVFLLDENNKRKGVYEKGEITFRSNYLSLGYLNRPELTDTVFINDFEETGDRIYKSGDIGLLLPTGEIEFLYRKDTQVKYNGVRIELSEIEHHLEQIEGIREAIVAVKTVENKAYITAYIAYTNQIEIQAIKKALQQRIPNYMIPGIYIEMKTFPLTRTGKIDRKALRNPEISDLITTQYVAPESKIEAELVLLWSEILEHKSETLGIVDNFFELGGNSLQAMTVINQINKKYHTVFSIGNLYETLTIKELATLVNFSVHQQQDDTLNDYEEIVI
ncbi:amino acid adenylation domain-containing protein [Kordia sp. YSTF-M3]|uniref:Amino acid adenylation domain-containing protein n=1 Tax=Kordia aestuariivivens TaxID=2759037 RepID=A0ABR7QH99_9FLAO|nr:non-ribosomal peptide synthetase [Kordia aestuariivivens]MBC8757699.1 amino acid adenylation domain-containing protein [Kordia aestuariivivens]